MADLEKDPIPEEFRSIAEAGTFWDTHSAADYIDDLEDVEIEFDIQHGQFMVPVDRTVYAQIKNRAEKEQKTISEMLLIMLQHELAA